MDRLEMLLPGITKEQMIEVDRIMMKEYHIPVELMMEHAGLNLARLALKFKTDNYHHNYQIIVGSGNNGGGGLVAARRLNSWGLKTKIYIPRGINNLHETPKKQLNRVQRIGIDIFEGLPPSSLKNNKNQMILDSYIGYGFKKRLDDISDEVFEFLSERTNIISLDAPSGLDVTTGETVRDIHPLATLTIAFVKVGFFNVAQKALGETYIVDIGVPIEVFRSRINIDWSSPYHVDNLTRLEESFRKNSLHRVLLHQRSKRETASWEIVSNHYNQLRQGDN
ncbi:MAG: NAD(P)H-hydrate epimerase [Candidatus Hodarchaeales archaeon]|jgi:NAD(P)H-hydrate epimerase